ncbi:hypothetical protein COCSUDRAFT_52724 [Coccomyxa subellipsoidea C-169]|uniref:Uncharacterized protein n=1 Tax=Coccomyxa subellipsoidea (strain C-169) TaxID=574566 RepID=I0Z6G0_COCSC|nr:hypothetical protein COCSUDRAFT_52724 [Coccomyxa subellipsoidea C-169]EIE26229.1 hypothetical protein COCSUDRAFT_52724 [Coccomyxa subellipsoidea C-169]|eukprot:XP_005650773.1 hypothetical protein COCSUDRAFT_52724 [Coccomyxa subellipsoidea C-169]
MHCVQSKEGPLESRHHSPLLLFQASSLWRQGQYCESELIKSLCSSPFSRDTSVTRYFRFHSAPCHGNHTPDVIPSVMHRVSLAS